MKSRHGFYNGLIFSSGTALVVGLALQFAKHQPPKPPLTKEALAAVLGEQASFYRFPTEVSVPLTTGDAVPAVIQYTFDSRLQDEMEGLMRQYRPDYGAFVAVDATTGRVLSMVSYAQDHKSAENLAL